MDWKAELGHLAGPVVVALLCAVSLWNGRARARNLARKWGLPDPTGSQVEEVLHYRRLRLGWNPLLYLPLAMGYGLLAAPNASYGGTVVVGLISTFFCGAVLAELLTLWRTRRLPPVRLRFADVVPRWELAAYGAVVVMTFAVGLLDLTAQPYITPDVLRLAGTGGNQPPVGVPIAIPFAGTAVVLLLVGFVVRSAWARSLSADIEIDRAFRTRSARVAVGLGIGVQLALLQLSWWRMAFLDRYGAGAAADPGAAAIGDWAQKMNDSVQLGMLLIFAGAASGWIFVVTLGRPPKSPQFSQKKA